MKAIYIVISILLAVFLGTKASQLYSISQVSVQKDLTDILTQCKEGGYAASVMCFRKRAESLVRRVGVNAVIDELDNLFVSQPEEGDFTGVSCHDMAHVVGELAARGDENIGEILAQCTNACGYGCQHGTLLGAVQKNPKMLEDLSYVCAPVSKAPFHSQDYDACVHGVGHAVSDIAGLEFSRAFALCDSFMLESERKICAEGVFMETIDAPSLGRSAYQFVGTIDDFCSQFSGVYQDACFETGGLHIFAFTKDSQRAVEACLTIPAVYTKRCVLSLMNTLYYVFYGQPEPIAAFCATLDGELISSCLLGAIQSDVVTNMIPENSIAVCEIFTKENRIDCFDALGDKVEYVYGRNIRYEVCQKVPTDMREECIN